MNSTRNIFLEAAMTGRPVIIPDDNKKKGTQQSTQNNKKPPSSQAKAVPIEDKELLIIKQAVGNVGRLPARVLRYVEMMATHLPDAAKLYYSSVGTKGGPSREAALKRISRKIKKFDEEYKMKRSETRTSYGSAASSSAVQDSSFSSPSALDLEGVYNSSAEGDEESDADKSYIYEPAKQTNSKDIDASKWLKETNKREKRKEIDSLLMDDLDVGDQETIPKNKKKKDTKKSKIDSVLDMLPGMMESVKSAADAHKKAVTKWQNISDSD